jgi:hypothetical protein
MKCLIYSSISPYSLNRTCPREAGGSTSARPCRARRARRGGLRLHGPSHPPPRRPRPGAHRSCGGRHCLPCHCCHSQAWHAGKARGINDRTRFPEESLHIDKRVHAGTTILLWCGSDEAPGCLQLCKRLIIGKIVLYFFVCALKWRIFRTFAFSAGRPAVPPKRKSCLGKPGSTTLLQAFLGSVSISLSSLGLKCDFCAVRRAYRFLGEEDWRFLRSFVKCLIMPGPIQSV